MLSPCPRDPSACRLSLVPLAPVRTQAALATKLGPTVALRQTALLGRQSAVRQARQAHTALRSSERAALLACSRPRALPNPRMTLARILREGCTQMAARQQVVAAGAAGAAGASAGQHPSAAARQALNAGVLALHHEQRKAFHKRRWVLGAACKAGLDGCWARRPCSAALAAPAAPAPTTLHASGFHCLFPPHCECRQQELEERRHALKGQDMEGYLRWV